MLRHIVLIALVMFMSSFATAEQTSENPKYEGIEITVNVNQASAQELADLLSGVGEKKAQAIVEYRREHGEFSSVDELVNIKGIGTSLIDKNRNRIEL